MLGVGMAAVCTAANRRRASVSVRALGFPVTIPRRWCSGTARTAAVGGVFSCSATSERTGAECAAPTAAALWTVAPVGGTGVLTGVATATAKAVYE